jgi:hypothetical protein
MMALVCTFSTFNEFLRTASRLGLMPPWWSSANVTAVKKLAKDPQKSFCIMQAQEVSDVRETWGAATTLMLRSLASRVYDNHGMSPTWTPKILS